jgi:hypothetical protein
MNFQLNPRLLLILCVAEMALAVGIIMLLLQVDGIVNVSLYGYGLVFDYEWATPYWTFVRVALALLGALVGVNGFLAFLNVMEIRGSPPVGHAVQKTPAKPALNAAYKIDQVDQVRQSQPSEKEDDGVDVVALPMVCNKCGKVFTQPLCMFDFKSGKPRLVNVCPYCNAVLAVSGNSKG